VIDKLQCMFQFCCSNRSSTSERACSISSPPSAAPS
jgi:hypothetical protein